MVEIERIIEAVVYVALVGGFFALIIEAIDKKILHITKESDTK